MNHRAFLPFPGLSCLVPVCEKRSTTSDIRKQLSCLLWYRSPGTPPLPFPVSDLPDTRALCDALHSFQGIVRTRCMYKPQGLTPCLSALSKGCRLILQHLPLSKPSEPHTVGHAGASIQLQPVLRLTVSTICRKPRRFLVAFQICTPKILWTMR